MWLALANRADEDGRCYPSIRTLQGDTGLARATVYRAISQLSEKGEITVVPGGGKGNPSNEYTIKGGLRDELVQDMNQCNPETKVVHLRDKGGLRDEHKPNKGTRLKNQTVRTSKKRFVEPTSEEVRAYCLDRKNTVDPQRFLDHYESNGWRVGRNAMKDWKAAVRTWEKNGFSDSNGEAKKQEPLVYRA